MAGMVGGRFAGDRLTDRFGGAAVLRGGMALVAAGLVMGIAVESSRRVRRSGWRWRAWAPPASSHWRSRPRPGTEGMSPGSGAATVSLAARLGFMVEPVLVGAVADLLGLRWAFGLVAVVALVLAAAAPRIIPAPRFLDDGQGATGRPPGAMTRQARLAMPPSTGMTAPVR